MIIKNKYLKIIFMVLVFCFYSIFSVFAQDEVEQTIDIYNSYEGWYKNFIVECGAVRVTLRNYNGSIIKDYYVLSKQFENNSEITRKLNSEGVDNQKDSEGRTIFFMQKNEGKLNLNDYTYKALNGSELERKYSNNIPQLTEIYKNKEQLSYIYFEEFSRYTTVETWKGYNNGENVNKLAEDLGFTSLNEYVSTSNNKTFYEWVNSVNENGVSPTLELQPITLYPETTEQIYCNDFYTAEKFTLQWNSDMGAYCEELNNSGILGWLDGVLMKLFGGKKIGIGDLITFYNGKLVYYDVGVMITDVEEISKETGIGKTFLNEEDRLAAPSEISKVVLKEILTPKYVPLTYTETTRYSHSWETKGFWANYQKVDVSNINYTLEEMLGMYFYYCAITECGTVTITNMNQSQYNENYKPISDMFNNLEPKTEDSVENLLKSKNKYYLTFENYYKMNGYEREGDNFHLPRYKGIGDTITIKTDHNKYTTIINMVESFRKTFELLLTLPDFLSSSYPKYGAGIIVNGGTPVATQSQILFKFHSNLEQLGGTGEIDETYNLFGKVGSSDYTYQATGNKINKIPKTYPDSVASSYKKANNSSYTYTTYTTIQGKEGRNGGGKRFKVDKTKVLTQDILDYAVSKQKEIDKKSLKSILENDLGLNYSKNKIKPEEGLTHKIVIEGISYYIDPTDADAWEAEVEKYNENEKSSKYVDEQGNEYTIVILYVDWLYEEGDAVSADFSLYEDELSFVFDYDSINSDKTTRKLTGTANNYTRNQHIYPMPHSYCGSTTDCNHFGSSTFSVNIRHTLGGLDYLNCILGEQQTSLGDGTYSVNIREGRTEEFLKGTEINHIMVGYRDKVKDLRTAYKNSYKNTSAVNEALPKYSIPYNYTPTQTDFLTSDKSEFIDKLGAGYVLHNEHQADGYIPACTNSGQHTYYCGGCEESCDDEGNCESYCPGHECYYHCNVGEIYTSLTNTTYGVSNIHNTYDDWNFKQYVFVGNDNSYGDIQFPIQDSSNLKTTTKGDNTSNTSITPLKYNNYTYKYYNNLEDKTLGNYNSKDLGDVEFYPFIRMRYKDTKSDNYNDAYILAQNKTGVKNFAIAEVAVQDTEDEPTIGLESQWDGWKDTMKGLKEKNWQKNKYK